MLLSDSLLNIKTGGIREQELPNNRLFNRTESTEYEALEQLFKHYQALAHPFWLDVGCGEGRVLFSAHYLYQCPAVGVELNSYTYRSLYLNRQTYLVNHSNNLPIELVQAYIHDYTLDRRINTIYLFNPFAAEIFKAFVYQLLESFYKYPREINLILYYPSAAYLEILREAGVFSLKQSIPFDVEFDERLRFEVFSLGEK